MMTRLHAYKRQTEPLVDYYSRRGTLKAVDGMAPIPEVAVAIDRLIAAAGNGRGTNRSGSGKSMMG
jgi:adenylate kinase